MAKKQSGKAAKNNAKALIKNVLMGYSKAQIETIRKELAKG